MSTAKLKQARALGCSGLQFGSQREMQTILIRINSSFGGMTWGRTPTLRQFGRITARPAAAEANGSKPTIGSQAWLWMAYSSKSCATAVTLRFLHTISTTRSGTRCSKALLPLPRKTTLLSLSAAKASPSPKSRSKRSKSFR